MFNVYDYWGSLQDVHTFSSVSGTESYYMPSHFDKPLRIFDLTNDLSMNIVTEENYVSSHLPNIGDSTTGTPTFGRIYGESPVIVQLSTTGSTVQAKSSTADTATVRVEGFIDSDLTVVGYENITLNGTTYVDGTTTFYKILHFSKSADTTGFITLASSGGTVLGYIAANDRFANHKVLKLGLIPNAANSYRVMFKRRYRKMVNASDYPFVESDSFLIQEASGYGLAQEKETYDKAQAMWNRAEESLKILLINHQQKYGPQFQHQMVSSNYRAHRG